MSRRIRMYCSVSLYDGRYPRSTAPELACRVSDALTRMTEGGEQMSTEHSCSCCLRQGGPCCGRVRQREGTRREEAEAGLDAVHDVQPAPHADGHRHRKAAVHHQRLHNRAQRAGPCAHASMHSCCSCLQAPDPVTSLSIGVGVGQPLQTMHGGWGSIHGRETCHTECCARPPAPRRWPGPAGTRAPRPRQPHSSAWSGAPALCCWLLASYDCQPPWKSGRCGSACKVTAADACTAPRRTVALRLPCCAACPLAEMLLCIVLTTFQVQADTHAPF